ncbi:MAG: alanine--glyoxylate aminotransferase family protein [Anaerolineae bacterium]|nr:alanine--glyoxylate aminotransferase family protein [Anaerolineae bacterium]
MDARSYKDIPSPGRILLGPGPSMVAPRVLRALALPVLGHLDPIFLSVMDDIQQLLRYTFQTKNEFTIPISGTGSAGMEAALSNFIEAGDKVLIGVNGYFGERLAEMAGRYRAQVSRIERPWGEVFDIEEIRTALKKDKFKFLALVHGETSTGALLTGVAEIAQAAHENGALLILDTVATLGGAPVEVDAWEADVVFSGSQKCLSCPPGLAPLTMGERARAVLRARKTPPGNWYLDLGMVEKYWGEERTYHHTAPTNMNVALREALRAVAEEGLEARFSRHQETAELLWQGLQEMDIGLLMPEENRMTMLCAALIPPGVDDLAVRTSLRENYNIEIAGGFGPLAGKIWRIGLMGFSSRRENVLNLLSSFREILKRG